MKIKNIKQLKNVGRRFAGVLLLLISATILLFAIYNNSQYPTLTRTFSNYTILTSSWEKYKQKFITVEGRVIDPSQNSITTSEGQSYAMLRSVWMDDKKTFDHLWQWNKDNLRRSDDLLFGWRWGQRGDNTYGFVENGGENSASDADTDIALSLLLARNRWQTTQYDGDLKVLLDDIWKLETVEIKGKQYLTAGNWANSSTEVIINPSYLSPYAWRLFANVDPTHDWNSLIDPAYELLTNSGVTPFDKEKGVGLPPDWLAMNKVSGDLKVTNLPNLTSNYSFDAIRVPWRIAMDYQWNHEQRAADYLKNSMQLLTEEYRNTGKLAASYTHDGKVNENFENPSMYATALAYLTIVDKDLADKMYTEKIINLYSNKENSFSTDLGYYEQNMLWFGAAFYHKALIPYQD